MKSNLIVLIVFVLFQIHSCLEFKTSLQPNAYRCFHEILNYNQKYRLDVNPSQSDSDGNYGVKIEYLDDSQNYIWNPIYHREQISFTEPTNIHKLGERDATYRFCIKNHQLSKSYQFQLNLSTGLQLMELHLLPQNSDTQILIAELQYLEKQKQLLIQSLKYADSIKTQTFTQASVISSSTFYGITIFTIVALVANAGVYWKTNKALQQRKSI